MAAKWPHLWRLEAHSEAIWRVRRWGDRGHALAPRCGFFRWRTDQHRPEQWRVE